MKVVFSFLLIAITQKSLAQEVSILDLFSTRNDSLPKLKFSYLFLKSKRYCTYENFIITSDSMLRAKLKACDLESDAKVDFTKDIVLLKSSIGDCHARFKHEVVMDTANKTLTWIEYDIDGGCRAAKFDEFWIVVQKPPEGYKVLIKEINTKRSKVHWKRKK